MLKLIYKISLLVVFALFQISCSNTSKISKEPNSLKKVYKKDFLIGTALGIPHILEKDTAAVSLILREFNAITPENIMKSEVIHPEWSKYNFDLSDKYVAFGEKNKMFIVGHTLIWHSQLPKFVGKITSSDSLKMFMTDHINTVAGRYAGKINSWDVVNEALNEDGTLRESIFFKKLGENYIKDAFDLAAKADPKADLYYNDYNNEQPAKRAGTIALIKKLQASGTKIDGVGIQGHWGLKGDSLISYLEQSIIEYAKLGVKVAITELDITVLPNPWDLKGAEISQNFEGSPKMNPFPNGLPDSVQTQLAKRYEDIFKVLIKHQDKISRVTFWGVNDGHSWLNGWPIRKRTNYPLLFDRNYQPKEAYNKVMSLKK